MWSKRTTKFFLFLQLFMVTTTALGIQAEKVQVPLAKADTNDHAPVFLYPLNSSTSFGYPSADICFEIFPAQLLRVQAFDHNDQLNGNVRFSLKSPNSEFEIDAKSGVVYPRLGFSKQMGKTKLTELDLEAEGEYISPITLQITATDRAGAVDALNTTISIKVHRLTADNYALVKYLSQTIDSDGTDILGRLSAITGYQLRLVKHAILPSTLWKRPKQNTETDAVFQLAWIYGFKADSPIMCSDLQDKISAQVNFTQTSSIIVESLEETGLSSDFYDVNDYVDDAEDLKSNIYLGIIGFLLLFDLAVVITYFCVNRGQKNLLCCFNKKPLKPMPPTMTQNNCTTMDPVIQLPTTNFGPNCTYPVIAQNNSGHRSVHGEMQQTRILHANSAVSVVEFQILEESQENCR